MFDGLVYRHRLAILYAYSAGAQLWRRLAGEGNDEEDKKVAEFISRYSKDIRLFGEAMVPYLVTTFAFLRLIGCEQDAETLFGRLLRAVARASFQDEGGLPDPYYDVEALAQAQMGLFDEPVDESFARRSFVLRALLILAARNGYRAILGEEWRRISHVSCVEFPPDHTWQFFL